MPETLITPSEIRLHRIVGVYLELLANRRYLGFALMMAMIIMPLFAFIGGSADIYITGMGLSEQTFGFFFSFNASAMMGGSVACTWYLRRGHSGRLLTGGFAGIFLGGLGLVFSPLDGPWAMALPMFLVTFCLGLSRPPSNHLVLEQVDRNAGAASSLLVFLYFMLGAFSMWLISLDWPNKIRTIGTLATINGGGVLLVWVGILRGKRGRKTVGAPEPGSGA